LVDSFSASIFIKAVKIFGVIVNFGLNMVLFHFRKITCITTAILPQNYRKIQYFKDFKKFANHTKLLEVGLVYALLEQSQINI
jgi:hypothetical protein